MNLINQAKKFNLKYNYLEICCKNKEGLNFKLNIESVKQFLEDGELEAKKYYRNFVIKEVIDDLINKSLEISKKLPTN